MCIEKLLLVLGLAAMISSCRTHRPTVEIQEEPEISSSLTRGGETESVSSNVKITALSLPPQPHRYDRLELQLRDQKLPDRPQNIDDYKLNTAITVKPHKTFIVTLKAYLADDLVYSNEYCRAKRSFRSQLGATLLTISLCPPPDAELDEDEDLEEKKETAPTPTDPEPAPSPEPEQPQAASEQ